MKRTVDFRYVVTRGGADFDEIYPLDDGAPTLRMDDSADIKTSLVGEFLWNDRVEWLSDRIRAEMIIDGSTHPLGVYLPATVEPSDDGTREYVQVEAYDQCWLVQTCRVEDRLSIAAGTNYVNAVMELLNAAGIINISATPTDQLLPEIREDWQQGDSYLEIINQLLSEINYKPLWFNASGVAMLEPESIPSIDNVRHRLLKRDVKSMILPGIVRRSDIFNKPNVFVCICDNPDKSSVMVAKSENHNMDSPLSIERRGRRIVEIFEVDNIASQTELERYAELLKGKSLFLSETAELQTALLPGYGVADVVAVSYDDFEGICIEHAWEMELMVGGAMQHTLERVVMSYDI